MSLLIEAPREVHAEKSNLYTVTLHVDCLPHRKLVTFFVHAPDPGSAIAASMKHCTNGVVVGCYAGRAENLLTAVA